MRKAAEGQVKVKNKIFYIYFEKLVCGLVSFVLHKKFLMWLGKMIVGSLKVSAMGYGRRGHFFSR